jgi:hypothetical protein
MNLKFYKIRANAKLPVRAHRTDAGMDLFYCPNGNRGACLEESGEYWLSARSSNLIGNQEQVWYCFQATVGCRCLCC